MNPNTRAALIGRSIPTDLVDKIESNGHTVAELRTLSRPRLEQDYSKEETALLLDSLKRHPIDSNVIDAILSERGEVCAYCADGISARPYQIHHIVPYSDTQYNSMDNLLLVCPTHHIWIHSTRESICAQKVKRSTWSAVLAIASNYE